MTMIDLLFSFFFVSVNQKFRGDIGRILKATEVEEFQSSNQMAKNASKRASISIALAVHSIS